MTADAALLPQARSLIRAGRFAEGERLLRQHLGQHPRDGQGLHELALLARRAGQPEAARKLLEQAVAGEGAGAEAWADLGTLRQEAGELEGSIAATGKALALRPGWNAPRGNLAAALIKLGRHGEALAAVEPLLAERPWHAYGLAYKAQALWELGRDDEALALLGLDRLVFVERLPNPPGYADDGAFRAALCEELRNHPSLTGSADPTRRAVRQGSVTGNLFQGAMGPATTAAKAALESFLTAWIAALPSGSHPWLKIRPRRWHLVAWGNVLQGAGHQAPHIHNLGWVSGVTYLELAPEIRADDPEEGGWIEFGRPGYGLPVSREPALRTLAPEEGALVLFPSSLWHATRPFTGEGERISLAFDLVPD